MSSLDSWTSLANRAYLALTAHGISKNFEFESFFLGITVVKKSETGEYIAELVRDILEAWAIDMHQVVAGTSDGVIDMGYYIYHLQTNLQILSRLSKSFQSSLETTTTFALTDQENENRTRLVGGRHLR